jgi:hypothetical protein
MHITSITAVLLICDLFTDCLVFADVSEEPAASTPALKMGQTRLHDVTSEEMVAIMDLMGGYYELALIPLKHKREIGNTSSDEPIEAMNSWNIHSINLGFFRRM